MRATVISLPPIIILLGASSGWCLSSDRRAVQTLQSRRDVLASSAATLVGASVCTISPSVAVAAGGGLAAKLSQRDPAALKNSVFNIPPAAQTYPEFMRGEWEVQERFSGYIFPSTTIPKSKVIEDVQIPGFQKCSIAAISDIGRESTTYRMRIDDKGREDRQYNLANTIGAHLGYNDAVDSIDYDPSSNPNRMSITFVPNRTRNAERIELFFNARESEVVPNPKDETSKIFVAAEYQRQVTFSLSQEFGVARQVVGNYAHFWTWREQPDGKTLTGNVLTAAYLDPQDALFFQEPAKPVVVYSHNLEAKRVAT